ncbi:arginine--tRNA ligase [Candidatus Woesearchaeota archaeon]|nr:arginine--tRNA ligase [Candidatus Woesearchaeota archaeon]
MTSQRYVLQECRKKILDGIVNGLVATSDDQEKAERMQQFDTLLLYQRRPAFGDFSLPVNTLSEQYGGLEPRHIAEMIRDSIVLPLHIKKEVKGGFLNFFVDREYLAEKALGEVFQLRDQYGTARDGKQETVIVEYSSPNYGKELHIGHIRSTVVGDVVSRVLKANGYTIIRINYPGDTGGHMDKVLVGLQEWYGGKLPDDPREAIKLMGNAYVAFEQAAGDTTNQDDGEKKEQRAALLKKTAATHKKIEDNDPKTCSLWERVCKLSREAHAITYEKLDIAFDITQAASSVSTKGKELVTAALEQGVALEYNGAVSIVLNKDHYLKIRSSDGNAVYATLDLGAAVSRAEEFNFDRMIYVVGFEQSAYFDKLFRALELLGYKQAKQCKHLATGHLVLEEGKMSSRQGNVVLLEDVLTMAVEQAKNVMREKNIREKDVQGAEDNIEEIAQAIGIGALKYFVLAKDPSSSITYNEQQAFNLKGKSAPFAQYAYASANSILQKVDYSKLVTAYVKLSRQIVEDSGQTPTMNFTTEVESDLIKKIADFPVVIQEVGTSLKLQSLTEYVHELATAFNRFYQETDAIVREQDILLKYSRVELVRGFQQTMKNALGILGIKVIEKM